MIIVADASTLIAELVRERGRWLLRRPDLRFLVATEQWEETQRGLRRRFDILRSRIGDDEVETLRQDVEAVAQKLEVIPRDIYSAREATARRRVRDASDWPTVALALTVHAPILTSDPDFVGCGVATWAFNTLYSELTAADDVENPSPAVDASVVTWMEFLANDSLPDEAEWAAAAARAAREAPAWRGNTDRCSDCKMMLPMDFSNGLTRRPCPRCVQTAESTGMGRAYARSL